MSALRHQRDLFSGGPSLGIPDVTTHVGSVIHAFENLAYQRQLQEGAEKPYESSRSTNSAGKKESIYKIILPPPPKTSTSGNINNLPKQIVRHRPKEKAPDVPTSSMTNTASATTQTTRLSADENESSALESLNLDEEFHRITANIPQQSYVKNYKVLPPFAPIPPHQPSRIPTKAMGNKTGNQQSIVRNNRMSQSLLRSDARTNVFLKPNKYSEDDVENDFLRGSTVSQSFIKNVIRKSPERKISTYEQNFLINSNDDNKTFENKAKRKLLDRNSRDQRSKSTSAKLEQPLIDEVSLRYKEYSSNNDIASPRHKSTRQQNFQPRTSDRAEL